MAGALTDVVVVDFSQLAQGPFATQILGDLGAEIIKIEAPSGDWMRGFSLQNAYAGGMSVSFITYNRNKRSIVLDLKSADGVDIAPPARSIERMSSSRTSGPVSWIGLGSGYETLAARNPRLVYCASVGYGQDGPYAGRPGQDLLVQSLAGLASLGGRDQDPPAPAGIGVADLAAGLHIVYGVLAALIARERTGEGQRVDVNMLNALLALEHQEIASYLYTGSLARRASSGIGSAYAGAPLGIYPTADGWLALSMQPLGRLAELLGVDGFVGVDSSNVIEGRDDIKRRLEQATRTRTTDDWVEHLLAHDVWCAPVNDLDRVVEDPQVQHNEILVNLDHPTAGPIRVVGSPVRFSGTPSSVRRVPPELGQDTDAILHDILGMTDDAIAEASEHGAFGQGRAGVGRMIDGMPRNAPLRPSPTDEACSDAIEILSRPLPRDRCGRLYRRVDDEGTARIWRPTPSGRTCRPTAGGSDSSPATRPAADARLVALDIVDRDAVRALVESERITHVIHLAALQAPFCRPTQCADRRSTSQARSTSSRRHVASRERVRSVVYASSAAVFGPAVMYPDGLVRDDSPAVAVVDDLRGLQAGQRVVGEGVRRHQRPADGRVAAIRRLRAGPRPGHDVRTVGGDPLGRRRRSVPHPVGGSQPVPLRRGRGARVHRREPGRGRRRRWR